MEIMVVFFLKISLLQHARITESVFSKVSLEPQWKTMKCLCEKDSGLCSAHSTSPYIPGCPSWVTSSESEVQQSPLSKSLSLKVDVLPQQWHKNKALSFQFQEQDSCSTQSTGQSYPEIGSTQSGQISIPHKNSSACSAVSGTERKSAEGLIRSSMGSRDFAFPPPLLDHSQSLAHIAFYYADPCYTGLLAAAYGPQSKIYQTQLTGTAPVRIPLSLDLKEPIYVNSKQYHAILRRRQYRAKIEAHKKLIKDRKPYLHKSRHLHALKRARGAGGRFLNTKKLQESKFTSANHGLNSSGCTRLNLSGNVAESKMHQVENYRDGAATITCSGVTCASDKDDFFKQHESEFRLCGYPSHIGRDMQDYAADNGGGVNQHHLSVLM